MHEDFFKLAAASGSFDPNDSGRLFHAVLLDIDHSPSHWLDERNSAFYTDSGLASLAASLHPGGVFGLWSSRGTLASEVPGSARHVHARHRHRRGQHAAFHARRTMGVLYRHGVASVRRVLYRRNAQPLLDGARTAPGFWPL